MTALLEKARGQLELGSPLAVRRACWLARAELEAIIHELLRVKGVDCGRASERAKLSCLEGAYVDQREVIFRAQYAWSRLSEFCHQHAYHLAPTHSEAQHLVGLVGDLRRVLGEADVT